MGKDFKDRSVLVDMVESMHLHLVIVLHAEVRTYKFIRNEKKGN